MQSISEALQFHHQPPFYSDAVSHIYYKRKEFWFLHFSFHKLSDTSLIDKLNSYLMGFLYQHGEKQNKKDNDFYRFFQLLGLVSHN